MKVTFITTINHNIGDDFVREGLLYLLEKRIGPFTAALIHKHIPLTARPEWEWFYDKGVSCALDRLPRAKGLFWSRLIDNSLPLNPNTDKVLTSNLLVQSGAPVYWKGAHNNEWYCPLFQRRYQSIKHRVPFINLGAGSCCPYHSDGSEIFNDPDCVAYIKELHSTCSVTTVRDALSRKVLNRVGLDAPVIPCPSIFAVDRFNVSPKEPEYAALNFMPLGGHYGYDQGIDTVKWEKSFIALYQAISREIPVILVCHDAEEQRHARRILPEAHTFLGVTARDYLEFYAQAHCFIGNRVHGAYAAASFGRPALVVGSDSRARMMEEIGLTSVFVKDATSDGLLASYRELRNRASDYPAELRRIKELAYASYMTALDRLGHVP
jgi:hypothetical protein